MIAATYADAIKRVLVHEGGYTANPADPGGPTNFGITIGDYRRYVKPNATAADVRTMRLVEAKNIYREKYWNAECCNELPAGVDYAVFDYGVNSGIGRSARVLQRIVGAKVDGKIGPVTIMAVQSRDAAAICAAICDERLRFLKSLRTWTVFGRGWGRRVAEVKTHSLALANASTPAPMPSEPSHETRADKGVIPQPKAAPRSVGGGGAAAGATAAASFWDWIQAHPWETAASAIGLGVAVALFVHLIHRNWERKQNEPMPDTPVLPIKEGMHV